MNSEFNNPEIIKSVQKRIPRSPRRITITVPYGAYQRLVEQSDKEGRSLSNLAAYMLERMVREL